MVNMKKVIDEVDFMAFMVHVRKIQEVEQSDMAKVLGISQASMSRLETGKSKIRLDQFIILGKYLDISIKLTFDYEFKI
jgi:DNA-binding XRE family transcriptional regulator